MPPARERAGHEVFVASGSRAPRAGVDAHLRGHDGVESDGRAAAGRGGEGGARGKGGGRRLRRKIPDSRSPEPGEAHTQRDAGSPGWPAPDRDTRN